jgi:type I restriction enzyme S subunit
MSAVSTKPLRDLCTFRHGGTPSKSNASFWKGDIPWVSPKDMKQAVIDNTTDFISAEAVANSATSVVPPDSILLVVRSGILAHSFPIAKVAKPVAFNQDIKAVTPISADVVPDYLYWFLRSQSMNVVTRGVKKGATVHSVQSGFIESLMVPMHPREEQHRIVDLLSRAEGIVSLRREAQQKAAELIPAIFIDMFGDPAINPKDLPLRSVRELVDRFEGGKNLQAGNDSSTAFRILKVSAVTSGEYVETESKPTPKGYEPPQSHLVRAGDMLFSRANTVELVGATAMVRATNGRTLLPDKLWRFVWAEPVDQAFMHALFQSAHVRQALGKLSSGTSASMRNISQAKLFELRLPIPSIREQRAFARRAEAAQSIRNQQEVALATAKATFDALLARAFA